MKKIFKGIAICSLGLLMGKSLIGTNSYYEVKNDTKLSLTSYGFDINEAKTGLDYTKEDICVKLEDTVQTTGGKIIHIGLDPDYDPNDPASENKVIKAIVKYKNGDIEIERCENPDLQLKKYDCSEDETFEGWYYDKDFTKPVEGTTIGDAMGTPDINIVYKEDRPEGDEVCLEKYNYITEVYAKCSKKVTPPPVTPDDKPAPTPDPTPTPTPDDTPSKGDNPNTGDNVVLYVGLAAILLASGIVVTKKLTNK